MLTYQTPSIFPTPARAPTTVTASAAVASHVEIDPVCRPGPQENRTELEVLVGRGYRCTDGIASTAEGAGAGLQYTTR